MSVLVDTGVLYAHHDTDAERHSSAVDAFDAVLDGAYGRPYVSDYVLDEAVTLARVRTGSFAAADTLARRVLGEGEFPAVFDFVYLDPGEVRDALSVFRRYDDQELSFTDASSIAACRSRDVDAILSFDADFDGVFDRIEPGSV